MSRIYNLSLDSLSDTTLSGLADNDILQYNDTTGKWENVTQQNSGFLVNFEDDITTGSLTAKQLWVSTIYGGSGPSTATIGRDSTLGMWVGDFATNEMVGIDANGENIAQFRRSDGGVNDITLDGPTLIDSTLTISDGGGFSILSDSSGAIGFDNAIIGDITSATIGGTLLLASGSITDSTGAISLGNENLSGTGNWSTTGFMGIGTTPVTGERLAIQMASGDTRGICIDGAIDVSATGILVAPVITPSEDMSFAALQFQPIVGGTSSFDMPSLAGAVGAVSVNPSTDRGYSGTITDLSGVTASLTAQGTAAGRPDIVNAVLFDGSNVNITRAGLFRVNSLNNVYGLKLPDVSGLGDTSNWAIYSEGGASAHVGNLRLGDLTVPTVALEVVGEIHAGAGAAKSKLTSIGGFAIKITNKTGAASVAGGLVIADTANDDAVTTGGTLEDETVGVFLDAGVADGAEAWVVISGIADVAFTSNTGTTRGYWVSASSTEAGFADNAASPTPARHWEEIGHCIETVATGGVGVSITARCILHFN